MELKMMVSMSVTTVLKVFLKISYKLSIAGE
jgi:hypothetical protein